MAGFIKKMYFNEKIIRQITKEFYDFLQKDKIILVDVGAAGGPISNFLSFKELLTSVCFEPDKKEYAKLMQRQNTNLVVFNDALYKKSGKTNFYINKKAESSSLLLSDREFLKRFSGFERFDTVDRTQLDVTTLDAVLSSHKMGADFIKLDTQGSELYILQGSKNVLSGCFGVQVEVEFYPVYKNQPLFADVDGFLRRRGYMLFDLRPNFWKRTIGLPYGKSKGQLIWADVLYFKDTNTFFESLKTVNDEDKFVKTLKAVLILVLYGYLDFALEIVNGLKSTVREEPFTGHIKKLEKMLKKRHIAYVMPKFWPMNIAAAVFNYLNKIFKVNSKDLKVEGENLGNL